MDDHASLETLLSGAGTAIAAAVLIIIAFMLLRTTGSANEAISLQSVASDVCGDIGTVAVSSVAFGQNVTYPAYGATIKVTSDFVIVSDERDEEFARPLPIRVYPGAYREGDQNYWSDTGGMREYINSTFGSPGTDGSPLNATAYAEVTAMMENSRRYMAGYPLVVSAPEPLTIEKLFLYTYNNTSRATECEPYVFVYQR